MNGSWPKTEATAEPCSMPLWSGDDDNPADFLSAGWWLHYPPGVDVDEFEMAERGVFIDGPELDLSIPPEMPISGEAIYVGATGGLYEYFYGSGRGELQGKASTSSSPPPSN